MDTWTRAPEAIEMASRNAITRDAHGNPPRNTSLARESEHDATNGPYADPDRSALLSLHRRDSGRGITNEPAQNNIELNSDPVERHPLEDVHWQSTSQATFLAMLALLILGVLTAISHHLFYSYLNKRPTDVIAQNWAIRIGTAFAYLFKMALVAAISVVYAQGFWFIVCRHAFEIGTLDDLFTLLTNPLRLFNRSLYRRASLLFGLALAAWLLPISAVFAPGALTGLVHFKKC